MQEEYVRETKLIEKTEIEKELRAQFFSKQFGFREGLEKWITI